MPESSIKIGLNEAVDDIVRAMPHSSDAVLLVRGLASVIRTNWIRKAQAVLNTSARDYVQGIAPPVEVKPGIMEIELTGRVPNMIEGGWPGPVDLRKTVIPNSRTKKRSAAGHEYVAVPFRHGIPGSSGANVGRAMHRDIYNVAKHLTAYRSQVGSGVVKAQGSQHRLMPGMERVGPKKLSAHAQELLHTKVKPWHTTSIYAGMVRHEKKYEAATQSQYKTWRMISTNPATMREKSWIHPGISARHIARAVQAKIGADLVKIIPLLGGNR